MTRIADGHLPLSFDLITSLRLLLLDLHSVLHRFTTFFFLDSSKLLLLLLRSRFSHLLVRDELLLPCSLLHTHQFDQIGCLGITCMENGHQFSRGVASRAGARALTRTLRCQL